MGGDKDCNVFNYCPKGADCTSGEGRCCSRKCHSTSKHDLELTHHWKGWDVYTRNDGRGTSLIDEHYKKELVEDCFNYYPTSKPSKKETDAWTTIMFSFKRKRCGSG